jgi:hypothetical protein
MSNVPCLVHLLTRLNASPCLILDPGHVREPETCFTRLPMMSYPRFRNHHHQDHRIQVVERTCISRDFCTTKIHLHHYLSSLLPTNQNRSIPSKSRHHDRPTHHPRSQAPTSPTILSTRPRRRNTRTPRQSQRLCTYPLITSLLILNKQANYSPIPSPLHITF